MFDFGFIGCGNMGGTLAVAVSKSQANIALADRAADTAALIAEKTGGTVVTNEEIAQNAAYVVLGVKPQVLPAVIAEIAPFLKRRRDRFVLISMAAGVTTASITKMLGFTAPIIRIMPNTPASVGEGMIVYTATAAVTKEETAAFEAAFAAAGDIAAIPETLIDAASAVSGCGPAFVYLFIEALADGGVRCGLPRPLALKLAAKTVSGSGSTVLLSGQHPGALKDAVCSPAGSTIEGVEVLEQSAFRGAVTEAVTAAFERTKELGK